MSIEPKEPVEFTAELVAMCDPQSVDVSQFDYENTAVLVFVAPVEEARKAAPLLRTTATLSTGMIDAVNAELRRLDGLVETELRRCREQLDTEREKYARALAAKDEGIDALRAERDAQRAATFEAIDRHQQAHAQAEFFKGEMQALRTERDALRAEVVKLETFIVDACAEKVLHGSVPSLIAKASKLGIAAFESWWAQHAAQEEARALEERQRLEEQRAREEHGT